MQVYKKILVTIDCSPVDETILEHVTALALQNRAAVYLLHVVHSHTLDQNRVLRENCEGCLSAHQDALRSKGLVIGADLGILPRHRLRHFPLFLVE